MSPAALHWEHAKQSAIRHDFPTWLVWYGDWVYVL